MWGIGWSALVRLVMVLNSRLTFVRRSSVVAIREVVCTCSQNCLRSSSVISCSESSGRSISSWDIKPFGAPRLSPAQSGMVTALLSKERFAPSRFLFPTSLTKLGLNLPKAFLERNPLCFGHSPQSAVPPRVRACARDPPSCVFCLCGLLCPV